MNELIAQATRTEVLAFLGGAMAAMQPSLDFEHKRYHDAIFHALAEANEGRSPQQIISLPPRMAKSSIVSVVWTAWLLGQDPSAKIMVLSYGDGLAKDLTVQTRTLMQSNFYREVFPGTVLETKSALHLRTTKGGERFSGSLLGTVTGKGADWLILDDPISGSDVRSPKRRKKLWRVFRSTIATRLNDHRTGRVLVVAQRLHDDDLTGHLLRLGGWSQLKLQAEATHAASIPLGGGRFLDMKPGDLLDPDRLSEKTLAKLKINLGTDYHAQFLQEPIPDDGTIIKRDWIRRYKARPEVSDMRVVLSVDTATKGGANSDFSVCTVWGKHNDDHYLLHVYRKRVDLPVLVGDIAQLYRDYRAEVLLIEDQGTGASLNSYLKAHHAISGNMQRPRGDKASRFEKAAYVFQRGEVLFPQHASWESDLMNEIFSFPDSTYDDQVDSISQYFIWHTEFANGFRYYSMREEQDPYEGRLWDPLSAPPFIPPGR